MRTPDARRDGVGWAYAGVLLGGAVSVAANVAHSFVPPAGVPSGWHPMRGAVLSAVFWPVSLFVALEILSRTTWPAGILWRVIRLGGLLPVAVVAAVVSYRHLSGLIRYYGEDGLTATFGPLAVDGLMVVASAALLASSVSPPIGVVSPADERATPPADVARSCRGRPSRGVVAVGRGGDSDCGARPRTAIDWSPTGRNPTMPARSYGLSSRPVAVHQGRRWDASLAATADGASASSGTSLPSRTRRQTLPRPSPQLLGSRPRPVLRREEHAATPHRSTKPADRARRPPLSSSLQDRQASVQQYTPRHCNLTDLRASRRRGER